MGYSLLICCAAFHGITASDAVDRWPNLTLKKIPKMVLSRCEWGRDDYSLNIASLPLAQPQPPTAAAQDPADRPTSTGQTAPGQGELFKE